MQGEIANSGEIVNLFCKNLESRENELVENRETFDEHMNHVIQSGVDCALCNAKPPPLIEAEQLDKNSLLMKYDASILASMITKNLKESDTEFDLDLSSWVITVKHLIQTP